MHSDSRRLEAFKFECVHPVMEVYKHPNLDVRICISIVEEYIETFKMNVYIYTYILR